MAVTTPLQAAVMLRRSAAATILLDAGANVNGLLTSQKDGVPNYSYFDSPAAFFPVRISTVNEHDSPDQEMIAELLKRGLQVNLIPHKSLPIDFSLIFASRYTALKYILDNPPPNYDINRVRQSTLPTSTTATPPVLVLLDLIRSNLIRLMLLDQLSIDRLID